MGLLKFFVVVCQALCLSLVAAASEGPLGLSVRTVNAPGYSAADTHRFIRRGLEAARFQKREELSGNTTLDKSWDGAVLLKFGLSQSVATHNENATASASESVEIVCTKCYIKGLAKAELQIPDNFNASGALTGTIKAVDSKVENFTKELFDYFTNYTEGVIEKFGDGIDLSDFAFPTFNYSFDMDIPAIPECTLNFQFDGMELYLQLNTILGAGATYELNLYSSNTPIGIAVGKDLTLGVVFKVDLILNVAGSIDISSGFHIKLEDGIAIDIALFGEDVSNIAFKGGKFEFLPVTVESAGVVLSAVLRIGIHSGIVVSTPSGPSFTVFNTTFGVPQMSGGIEVGVFANIAEFITNVTLVPNDPECELKVKQEYQLALGAAAGASVALDTETWGPVAATSIPIWNTAFVEVCAIKGTPSAASATPTITAGANKRADLTTTTIETTIKHTGVVCVSSGLANCPVSLQSTTQSEETRTLTTAVPSGEKATFPQTIQTTVGDTVAFGSNVQTITPTSGSPTSYTPTPTPTGTNGTNGTSDNKGLGGEVGGVSKKVIVGVSVGLGIPIIAAIIVGFVLWRRKKAYKAVPHHTYAPPMVSEPYRNDGFEPYRHQPFKPTKTGVSVSEVRH